MNTAGNISSFTAPPIVAYILAYTNDNWTITFYVSAAIYLIGAAAWFWIDPITPLEPTRPAEARAHG